MNIRIVVFAIAGFVGLSLPSISFGQSFLERLEKSLSGAIPPAKGKAEVEKPAEPGFLGMTADEAAGKGVKVVAMRDFGPAQIGGLEIGDLISAVDGKQIRNLDEMAAALTGRAAGTKVEFRVSRNNKEQAVSLRLGKKPGANTATKVPPPIAEIPKERPRPEALPAPIPARAEAASGKASLGVTVIDVTEEARRRYALVVRQGALIVDVRPGSPAERAGLPIGGVIVAVDGRRVDSYKDLINYVRTTTPGKNVELTYYQGNQLYRKSLRIGEGGVRSPAAEWGLLDGLRDGSLLGGGGEERPAFRALERVIDGLARPADESTPAALSPDVAELNRQIIQMRNEMERMQRRIELLESKLKAR